MDISTSAKSLSTLAQESRLNAFCLLVPGDSEGQIASGIAGQLSIPEDTLSSSLSIPSNAELIASDRINFNGTGELPALLMADCCQRQPNLCLPVLDSLLPGCCASSDTHGEQHEKNAR